jgi:alkanesulfonate monooxygenase SsuD/methylene tetrahydromethanopterin reductase-like flavin-dependent oxidoreductase (luciferase family)
MAPRWGLSLALDRELADPAAVAEVARVAERAGWDGLFVWDHLWHRDKRPFADPWVTLAAVAAATSTIRLGPLVTPLPRRRPQVVAQQAATLDRLSRGRLILALGLGHDRYGEYSTFGEPAVDDRSRAELLDAGIDVLLGALAGESPAGSVGHSVAPSCVQQPRCPIWVAGRAGKGAGPRRAARHRLEGIALVGGGTWTAEHVAGALAAGGFAPGDLEVALVGGTFDDLERLAAAGATWVIPELGPGTSGADARAVAAQRGA